MKKDGLSTSAGKAVKATKSLATSCFLCDRPLGAKVEWHHPVPRSRGGRHTEPVHPICHRTIHALFSNKELERSFASADALRGHPEMQLFLRWIEDKHPDFHAPTRQRKK